MTSLYPRQYGYGYGYGYNNNWSNWGRWVVLGVILLVAFILFFLCSCISQRRRRKAGRQPFYGTGWTQNVPYGGGAQYNPNYQSKQNAQAPPPEYGQQSTTYNQGGYYGQNQGYFGGQQTDVEMQPPQTVYGNNRADAGYAPPPGPPPAVIR